MDLRRAYEAHRQSLIYYDRKVAENCCSAIGRGKKWQINYTSRINNRYGLDTVNKINNVITMSLA